MPIRSDSPNPLLNLMQSEITDAALKRFDESNQSGASSAWEDPSSFMQNRTPDKIAPVSFAPNLPSFDQVFSTVASVANAATQALRDQLDVNSLLPDPQSQVVEALSLDAAVASQGAAQVASTQRSSLDQNAQESVGPAAPTVRQSEKQVAPPALSARAQHLLSSFQGSFPDKRFSVTEKDGQITLNDLPDAAPIVQVPTNYNPAKAQTGLQDLQRTLADATTPEDQLTVAYQIKATAATMGAAKYRQYVSQAEQEFNVPDLIQSVATSRQLDATHAGVIASGAMSMQTDAALRELASARANVNKRTSDLMKTDPVLSTATDLADMTIEKLKLQSVLGGREDIAYVKNQQLLQERAAIATEMADTQKLNRLAILRSHQPLPEDATGEQAKLALATGIITKKVVLSPLEQALVGMPAEDLKTFYLQNTDKTVKARTKEVMIYEEAKLLRGKTGGVPEGKVASANVDLYEKMVKGVTDATNADIPPQIKATLKTNLSAAILIPVPAEKAKAVANAYLNASNDFVQSEVIRLHGSDVRSWAGEVQADATAKAVLKQYDEKLPGKPIALNAFISSYLNYNSGTSKPDKITALRRIAASSVDAMQESIVFPRPPVASFVAQVDRQVANRLMEYMGQFGQLGTRHGFLPFGPAAAMQGVAALSSGLKDE